jgi:hypothetical protein
MPRRGWPLRPAVSLLVDQRTRERCFATAYAQVVDARWTLVRGAANPTCVAKGRLSAAVCFYELNETEVESKKLSAYAAVRDR